MLLAPPSPPVSYAREIAPVLAMRCNSCHGEAGGLSTRTYIELMAGGNLGKVIIAGNADGSLLVRFLDGRRGEARRMPLGSKALPPDQIRIIRQWIDEGAREDSADLPRFTRALKSIPMPRGRVLLVSCRVRTEAYLTMRVRHPRTRRILLERVGTADRTGEVLSWDVHPGKGWPNKVDIDLQLEYTPEDPGDVKLTAEPK